MELDNKECWLALARSGKTLDEVSEAAGYSKNYMYRLLNHKGHITPYVAGKIAKSLDTDVSNIVREMDDDDRRYRKAHH